MLPVSAEDLNTLINMGLVDLRDDVPGITDDGERALGL
jgi:hypothetical protein